MAGETLFRRMIFRRYGSPDVFEWDDAPVRALASGEVLLRVRYIGVNYADIIARRGYYKWIGRPPACPGFEVAGEVIDKASDVALPLGARVAAITRFGGYTEALIARADRLIRIPDEMPLQDAAALPAVYITAYHSLVNVMRVRRGESILIQAVAGSVGTAALQLAKHFGLTTYGTASSEKKLEFARQHGLDHGINYRANDFEDEVKRLTGGRGVQFVLDSLGGYGLRKGMRCLATGGHCVTIGAAGVVPPIGFSWRALREWRRITVDLVKGGVYHPFKLLETNSGISGVQILLLWDEVGRLQPIIEHLMQLYREGAIKPAVGDVFSLAEVARAHALVESRGSMGKVLLKAE